MTAVRGNFAVATIAQELRTQWSEQDLRRRDHGGRGGPGARRGLRAVRRGDPGGRGHGLWAMQEAYREQDEAYAALQVAKQTLREARAKQKFVKLSRQYYGKSGTGKGAGKSKSKGQSSGSRDDTVLGLWEDWTPGGQLSQAQRHGGPQRVRAVRVLPGHRPGRGAHGELLVHPGRHCGRHGGDRWWSHQDSGLSGRCGA